MGIRGLSSYIQARSEKYLQNYELQNTPVIIDGNNFMCSTYLDCPRLNPAFGGDYNVYFTYLREILNIFKQCHIKPYFIFDGGLDINNRKLRQRIIRAKAKIISSIKVKPSNQSRMKIFPVFFKFIFLDLLKEMKFEIIQCIYEADQEIGSLARSLQCPVISNDSDFFVVNVMVIPFSSIDFSRSYKNTNGLAMRCKLFQMDHFLKCIGYKDSSIFPLLGTLLGNDYVDARKFENIYCHISIPKSKSMCDQHCRIAGLLQFLRGELVEDAICKILTYVKKVNQTEVELAIRTSLKAYAEETSLEVLDLESLRERIVGEMTEGGCPEWFARAYCQSEIQSWVIELMFCRKMPFHSQVESVNMSYTFNNPQQILKAIALICLPLDNHDSFQFLARKRSELVFKRVKVSVNDFPFRLPKLPSVTSLTTEERQTLFFDVMLDQNHGKLKDLPEKWWLFFSSLMYWARHSSTTIRSYHSDALICSLIHFSTIEPCVGRIRSAKRLANVRKVKSDDVTALHYLEAVQHTLGFHEVDERMLTHDSNFDRDLVHIFGQFQATLNFATILNKILCADLELPNVATFYCGTFIYNAAVEFRTKGDRLKILERIYGASSPLFQMFIHFSDIVIDASPSSLVEWVVQSSGSQTRRRKKKMKESVVEVAVESSSSEEVCVDESDIDDELLMNNRFHLLKLK